MRKPNTDNEIHSLAWRLRHTGEIVFHAQLLDAIIYIKPTEDDSPIKCSIENSMLLSLDDWDKVGDDFCNDAGQNWWIHDVQEKVRKIRHEIELWIFQNGVNSMEYKNYLKDISLNGVDVSGFDDLKKNLAP